MTHKTQEDGSSEEAGEPLTAGTKPRGRNLSREQPFTLLSCRDELKTAQTQRGQRESHPTGLLVIVTH